MIYIVDTWTNYCTPEVGKATVTLLEHAGYRVVCPPVRCCGRPAISQGLLADAKNLAEFNVETLNHSAGPGTPILGSEPSCLLTYLDEYPHLLRTQASRRIADRVVLVETFLRRLLDDQPEVMRFRPRFRPLLYHAHCHQKALVGTSDANALMQRAWGALAKEIDSGCCGMAGAFGHETEHYDIARAIGEHRLFPAVRNRGDADVAVAGYSCRSQIRHHFSFSPKHLLEYLAESMELRNTPSTF